VLPNECNWIVRIRADEPTRRIYFCATIFSLRVKMREENSAIVFIYEHLIFTRFFHKQRDANNLNL
jgi:hypothetical protein